MSGSFRFTLLLIQLLVMVGGRNVYAQSTEVRVQSEIIELSRGETLTGAYAVLLKDESGHQPSDAQTPELNTRSALIEKLGVNRYRIVVNFEEGDFRQNSKYVVFATVSSGRVMSSPTRILALRDTFTTPAGVTCIRESRMLDRAAVALLSDGDLQSKIEEKKRVIADLEKGIRSLLNVGATEQLDTLEERFGVVPGERWSKRMPIDQIVQRIARVDCVRQD